MTNVTDIIEPIRVNITRNNIFMAARCNICGDRCGLSCVNARTSGPEPLDVCAGCIEAGAAALDARLEAHAAELEDAAARRLAAAAETRAMKGRLVLPTFAEWRDARELADLTHASQGIAAVAAGLSASDARLAIAAEVERRAPPSASAAVRETAAAEWYDLWEAAEARARRAASLAEHLRIAKREVHVDAFYDDGGKFEVRVLAGPDEFRSFSDFDEAMRWAETRAAELGFEIDVFPF